MMRSFEDSLNAHKSELTEALIFFGEHKRVNKVLAEVEMQRPDFYKFYKDGQESRQTGVDELKCELKRINLWYSNVKLQLENKEIDSAIDAKKIDELQKRVDAAQKLIDDWNCGGVHIFDLLDELEQALKGGSDE